MQDFEALLKTKGLRVTKARKDLFSILSNTQSPLSAQDIFKTFSNTSAVDFDQVSIYRNLTVFLDLKIVHKIHDGKFKLCSHKHKSHDHIHLVSNCSKCGNTSEIKSHTHEICKLANKFTEDASSLSAVNEIVFYGVCPKCSKK